jgi:hypothetical protein
MVNVEPGASGLLRRGAVEIVGRSEVRRMLQGTSFELQEFDVAQCEADWFEMSPSRRQATHDPPPLLFPVVQERLSYWNRGFASDERLAPAVREILANAFGHRLFVDPSTPYSRPGVIVRIFPDCVAFESSGPPPTAFVGVNDGAFVGRWSRNPMMAALLTRAGFMEQHGAGFARACARLASSDLQVSAAVEHGRTIVRFSVGDSTPGGPAVAAPPGRTATFASASAPRRPSARASLPVRIERALSSGTKTITELAAELKVPRSTVSAAVKRLVAAGRLAQTEPNPRSPKQRYRIR